MKKRSRSMRSEKAGVPLALSPTCCVVIDPVPCGYGSCRKLPVPKRERFGQKLRPVACDAGIRQPQILRIEIGLS